MSRGRVYCWTPDRRRPLGGLAEVAVVTLPNLSPDDSGRPRLRGAHVTVRNAGEVNLPGADGCVVRTSLGDASPDGSGDFLFEQGRGGGRMDKVGLAEPDFRWRYVQASRFGEVNAYYHVDKIASYVDDLLRSLGAPPLPPVTVAVNAHHAATSLDGDGRRDGVAGRRQWLPFQGGHYRLSNRTIEVEELAPVTPTGEIHLGPGWRLLEHGALVEAAGGRYRANASHNPGIIYHEFGHHITRHTADLSANAERPSHRQDNRKTALDEGVSDYWAAAMLETPHIWAFHHRHEGEVVHPRSLVSAKTMADYDRDRRADAHANGTIWGATLWDLRTRLAHREGPEGARAADRLVLASLLGLGQITWDGSAMKPGRLRRLRSDFLMAAVALLEADATLYDARHREQILQVISRRGIAPHPIWNERETR
jgi:hypothetical protein